MTKNEAIEAMKSGALVTHTTFSPEEYITMQGNLTIVTEEGYSISTIHFWNDRKHENFNNNWSIWINPSYNDDSLDWLRQFN